MSYEDYAIFDAPKGSVAFINCDDYFNRQSAAWKANMDFAKSLGATNCMIQERVIAYAFGDSKAPKGFKTTKKYAFNEGEEVWVIDTRTREGKALKSRVEDLPCCLGRREFDKSVGVTELMINQLRIMSCASQLIAGKRIIFVPLREDGTPYATPEGAIRIKLSEFFRMKEEETKGKE